MLERRNRTRRAICGGLVVGSLAGASYAALELAWLPRASASAVALALFGVALVLGALAGTIQGLLVAAVARAADALATSRLGRPGWAALLYTAPLVPVIAWLCAEGFSGPTARTYPMHDLYVFGAGALLIVLTYLTFRVLIWGRPRLEGSATASLVAAVVFAGVATGLHAVNHAILRGVYGFFHISLEFLGFAALELAVLSAAAGARAGERRWARVAAPRGALAMALVAVTLASLALARYEPPPEPVASSLIEVAQAILGRLD